MFYEVQLQVQVLLPSSVASKEIYSVHITSIIPTAGSGKTASFAAM